MFKWVNLRNSYGKAPYLSNCPNCNEKLEKTEIGKSSAGHRYSEYAGGEGFVATSLHKCNNCNWWAIRETQIYLSCADGEIEFMIFLPKDANLSKNEEQLWEKIINDTNLKQDQKFTLSVEEAKWIFGTLRIDQKFESKK